MPSVRLPDFVIIGAMKSATSTLYEWLKAQPEIFVASPKEVNFFAEGWSKGVPWYADLFVHAGSKQLLGEASVAYASAGFADIAAERMAATIPEATLIYVVRHPIDRIRSHYRHERQRNRESRSLVDALREPSNPYVANSMYFACLAPYIARFPRDRIAVVRFEDLVELPRPGWSRVLETLGLDDRPAPGTAHNVTSENSRWTRAMSWITVDGRMRFPWIARLPGPIRHAGKRVLMRGGDEVERLLRASEAEIPPELVAPVWDDMRRLDAWLRNSDLSMTTSSYAAPDQAP